MSCISAIHRSKEFRDGPIFYGETCLALDTWLSSLALLNRGLGDKSCLMSIPVSVWGGAGAGHVPAERHNHSLLWHLFHQWKEIGSSEERPRATT